MITPKWNSTEEYMRDTAIWKQNWINNEIKQAIEELRCVQPSPGISNAIRHLETAIKVNAI